MNFDKFVRRMQKTNHDKKAFLAGIGVVDERIQKSHSAGGGGILREKINCLDALV